MVGTPRLVIAFSLPSKRAMNRTNPIREYIKLPENKSEGKSKEDCFIIFWKK